MSSDDEEAIHKFRERIANGYKTSRVWYEPKTAVEGIKMAFCHEIIRLADKHELNTKDVAFLVGTSSSRVAEIFNFRIENLTTDFLIETIEAIMIGVNRKIND